MARITRTWLIDEEQAKIIARLADSMKVNHSRVVRYLLTYALREVAAGRLELRTRPIVYDLIDELPDS
jgi:hypothetical protein